MPVYQRIFQIIFFIMALSAAAPAKSVPPTVQLGGDLRAIAGDGIVYLGQGATIVTVDVNAGPEPEVLDVSDPLPGIVEGLGIDGDRLYAAWRSDFPDSRIEVFSIADPSQPVRTRTIQYAENQPLDPGGLTVVGSTVYMIDGNIGVIPIDVADPENPVVGSAFELFGLNRVKAMDDSTLVVWGRGFSGMNINTLDISQPMTPTLLGFMSSFEALDVVVGTDILALVGFGGAEIVNADDPAHLLQASTIPEAVGFSGVLLNNRLVVGSEDSILVWDLADLSEPVQSASLLAPADRSRIYQADENTGRVTIFTDLGLVLSADFPDIGFPNLRAVASLPFGTNIPTSTVSGKSIIWTDFHAGLWISDFELGQRHRIQLPRPTQFTAYEGIDVQDDIAYVTDWGYGLRTVDVGNPASPVLLGSLAVEFLNDVVVSGDRGWAVQGTNLGQLYTFDLSNPADPSVAAVQPVDTGRDIKLQGSFIYTAGNGSRGAMTILDVSGPLPVQVSTYGGCVDAVRLDVDGALAAIPCTNGDLHIVDISNPQVPTLVAIYSQDDINAGNHAAAIDGSILYFGHSLGVDVIDVSQPDSPELMVRVDLGSPPSDILALPDSGAWVSNGASGGTFISAAILLPALGIDRPFIDFGGVITGSSASADIILRNVGGSPLQITGISEPTAPFSIVAGNPGVNDSCALVPFSLNPDTNCSIRVQFEPAGAGDFFSSIQVDSNAPDGPALIQLAGNGTVTGRDALPVPVLDRWGMIILALSIIGIGGYASRCKIII